MRYLCLILLLFSGCTTPRIFQQTVPSVPQDIVTEDIRQASTYIYKESPTDLNEALVARVGYPEKVEASPEKIIKNLNAQRKRNQKQQDKFINKVNRYSGKPIEGSGFNLIYVYLIGGIIVLGIFPVLIPYLIQFIMGTTRAIFKGTTKSIVTAIEEFKTANPDKREELEQVLGRKMDRSQKAIVKRIKGTD